MAIECSEYILASLLNARIERFQDEAARMYGLTSPSISELVLSLFVSEYEEELTVSITHKNHGVPLIELTLNEVKAIEHDLEKITIRKQNCKVFIYLNPIFSIVSQIPGDSAQVVKTKVLRYSQYQLIELFEALPTISRRTTEIIEYTTNKDKAGFSLAFLLYEQEKYARIILNYQNFSRPIFDLQLIHIEKIEANISKLEVYRLGKLKPITIFFKPEYALQLNIDDLLQV